MLSTIRFFLGLSTIFLMHGGMYAACKDGVKVLPEKAILQKRLEDQGLRCFANSNILVSNLAGKSYPPKKIVEIVDMVVNANKVGKSLEGLVLLSMQKRLLFKAIAGDDKRILFQLIRTDRVSTERFRIKSLR